MYPTHHMMQQQHPVAVAAIASGPPQQPRPASNQNQVYQGYETTHSPITYNSPNQQNSSSVLNRMQKPANTSPSPIQQPWNIGRQVVN